MSEGRDTRDTGPRSESGPRPPVANGRKLRERGTGRTGTVVDFACQYAHPKADPVFNYLVRWEDGQIQAVSEAALDGSHGLEVLD